MADSKGSQEKVPPYSKEAEESVLGAMMLSKEATFKAFERIWDSNVFYFAEHRFIYTAMNDLFNDSQPIDQITVSDKLKQKGQLEKVGGSFYVTGLLESTPLASNIDNYIDIIIEKVLLRNLISLGGRMTSDGYDASTGVSELIESYEQKIFQLTEGRWNSSFRPIEPIIHDTMEYIDKISQTKGYVTGIPSGYTELDKKTAGFQNSNLIIIAARPSVGKTALALSMAKNMALTSNTSIGFFSLEMSAHELALRLLCMEAKVSSLDVKMKKSSNQDRSRLVNASNKLFKAPIFIDDTAGLTVLELRAKARRLKAEYDIGVLFVDYLQLMTGPTNTENRQQEISTISRSLKATAKELNIPIIALSQLSRAPEQRGTKDRRPQLSDLRESGALEQDADLVLFIYREGMYDRYEEGYQQPSEDEAEIIIGKQRNGPTGTVSLTFLSEYARFENRAFEYDTPPF